MTDWDALFRAYAPVARRAARGAIGDRPEVDDAVSVVWLRLLDERVVFDPARGDWRPLIVTMARSAAYQQMHQRVVDRRRVYAGESEDEPDVLDALADPRPTPEQVLTDAEQAAAHQRAIRAALAALTPLQRRVVTLRAESLTTDEIGAQLGISRASVIQALGRSRRRLRALLAGRVPLPPDRGRWGLPRLRPSRDGSPNPRTSAGNGSPSLQASVTD